MFQHTHQTPHTQRHTLEIVHRNIIICKNCICWKLCILLFIHLCLTCNGICRLLQNRYLTWIIARKKNWRTRRVFGCKRTSLGSTREKERERASGRTCGLLHKCTKVFVSACVSVNWFVCLFITSFVCIVHSYTKIAALTRKHQLLDSIGNT